MGRDKNARMTRETGGAIFTRRGLLQRAAWLTAAAAFPCAAEIAAQDVSPVMTALSNYMSEARNRELPDKVLQETKHHILDTIAAMVSGSELPPGTPGDSVRSRLWRRKNRDGGGVEYRLRSDRGGLRQWRARPFG